MSRSVSISIIVLSLSIFLVAQNPPPQPPQEPVKKGDKDYVIKVDTTLIQIPVSIHDKDGRPVNTFKKEQFQVFEDKIPQEIKLFAHEDVPLSLGLVIDNSGSMRNKRERVNSAALSFVRESNPEDESFIVNFDDSAYLEQDFTSSIGDLMDALDNLDTRGETALYDAVFLSTDKVMKEGRRDTKALLLISDGEDNTSKYKYEEVLKRLKEANVTLYAIGLLEESESHGLFQKDPTKKAKQVLEAFAEGTGGVAYFPKSVDEVEELCKQIARDLRNRYTIGYTPTNGKLDGSLRKVDVVVNAPKTSRLAVRWKTSYLAPKAAGTNNN
jgi:Ca-activated chloride channel family protein